MTQRNGQCDCSQCECGPADSCSENGACDCACDCKQSAAIKAARIRRTIAIVGMVAVLAAAIPLIITLYNAAEARKKAREQGARFDDSAVRFVDPKLVKYTELSPIQIGLGGAKAIAIDKDGLLYVAADNAVRIFKNGEKNRDITVEGKPQAITVAPDGTIFLAMKDHVELYSPDGQRKAKWSPINAGSQLVSIAVNGADVWVGDWGRKLVYRCDMTGRIVIELGHKNEVVNFPNYPGLMAPSAHLDLAIDASGTLWVANPQHTRLEAYTRDGAFVRMWGTGGPDLGDFMGCCNPGDFAILPDGSFVTGEKGVGRVKKYSADGKFLCVVAPPSAFGREVRDVNGLDVAATADGKVIVLEAGTQVLRVFAPIEESKR